MTDAFDCGCAPDACPLRLLQDTVALGKRLEAAGVPPPASQVSALMAPAKACRARRQEAAREREREAAFAARLAPLVLAILRNEGAIPNAAPVEGATEPEPQPARVSRIESLRSEHGPDVRALCIAPCIGADRVDERMKAVEPVLRSPPFQFLEFSVETLPKHPQLRQVVAYYLGPPPAEAREMLRGAVAPPTEVGQ